MPAALAAWREAFINGKPFPACLPPPAQGRCCRFVRSACPCRCTGQPGFHLKAETNPSGPAAAAACFCRPGPAGGDLRRPGQGDLPGAAEALGALELQRQTSKEDF